MKNLDCKFVGTFYSLDQIPNDSLPQIAFAGRSNVGKSSLLNKLIGKRKHAKVSQTPGKTRALNFFLVNEKFYFVDLPGYGYAKGPVAEKEAWGKLIGEFLTESKQLIGLLLLLDCRRDPNDDDKQLIEWLAENELPCVSILTKADKLTRDKINRKAMQIKNELGLTAIPFSAVTGIGKEEILKVMKKLLNEKN